MDDLIQRLEAAESGDRWADWLVADATSHPSFDRKVEGFWPPFMKGSRFDKDVPAYTTSLDAALALAERFLPGWRMHALQDQDGIYQIDNTATRWFCGVSEKHGPGNVMSKAATPALALSAAILKAARTQKGAE